MNCYNQMNYQNRKSDNGIYEGEQINFSYISDKNPIKQVKEDTFLILAENVLPITKNKGFMFAIMDGMGGQEGGYIASSFLQKKLIDYYNNSTYEPGPKGIKKIIKKAQQEFQNLKNKNKIPKTSGTTLSLALLYDKTYHFFHMGDSRIYLLRDGEETLKQITTDHSYNHGGLNNYFGKQKTFIEEQKKKQEYYDLLLLSSDRLNESIDIRTISSIMIQERDMGVKKIKDDLHHFSRKRGSIDDLTLIVSELLEKI